MGKLLAALPTKWSPVTAPATSYGGDRRRLRRCKLELEKKGESEDAQETRELTLDALVLAVVKEEDGGGGDCARRAAAGVEEDVDGGDEFGPPATIPCTGRMRTTRRSYFPASIGSARLLAAATSE